MQKYAIIKKMHEKYADVVEYYRESQKFKEVNDVIKEYQGFEETY